MDGIVQKSSKQRGGEIRKVEKGEKAGGIFTLYFHPRSLVKMVQMKAYI